jgi:hypothetical protein
MGTLVEAAPSREACFPYVGLRPRFRHVEHHAGRVLRRCPALAPLERDEPTIPSAIFFDPDGSTKVGRAGVQAYVDGQPGRLMRSLKEADDPA